MSMHRSMPRCTCRTSKQRGAVGRSGSHAVLPKKPNPKVSEKDFWKVSICRLMACLAFFRFFFSSAGHKWQNLHSTPLAQPFDRNAHGLHICKVWAAEPMVGQASVPTNISRGCPTAGISNASAAAAG
eukprot:TRINITY_DN6805_c0_g1_i3.p2 TRINITY_DN6805_c0_g1~~TRINITY_DN6805_c0_g1_i3.p2  ORF type:complete len:128 (+),score=16.81 TRINITY_DN6805_c0_g1_i3:226-609(+)